jgi:heterodisulfide reductase subunit A-like polyferredoxin
LCEEIKAWPEISGAVEIQSACSPQGADEIEAFIEDNQLDKCILAACSCCSMDQVCFSCTYQRIRCKGNLEIFSDIQKVREIDFVNIREGCAYIHSRSKKKATQEARRMISAALHGPQAPIYRTNEVVGFPPEALVIGKGKSAEVCQAALSEVGFKTKRLEILSSPIIRSQGKFTTQGLEESLQADCLVLTPTSGAELDYISKSVQLSGDRPLLDGKDPEDARRLGIFISLPSLDPGISGRGVAGEVLAWAGKMRSRQWQPAAWVDPLLCRSCGTCLEVCGLGIPDLFTGDGISYAWINPLLCLDCGTCTARCPSGAIQPGIQTDLMLVETLKRVMS